jgi:hypothetical protein
MLEEAEAADSAGVRPVALMMEEVGAACRAFGSRSGHLNRRDVREDATYINICGQSGGEEEGGEGKSAELAERDIHVCYISRWRGLDGMEGKEQGVFEGG